MGRWFETAGERIAMTWAAALVAVVFLIMNPLVMHSGNFPMFLKPKKPHPVHGTRDPLQQPFATTSVWNTPIGSGATFVNTGWTALEDSYSSTHFYLAPQIDEDLIALDKNAPLTNVETSSVGFGAGDRCLDTGATLATLPIPTNWLVPDNSENGAAALLAADGRTLKHFQPFTRCVAGSFATALGTTSFVDSDLYGDGLSGSHGGSKLSTLGGTIRLGEMRPGQPEGPHHALKMNIDPQLFFFNCTTTPQCHRWPAFVSDSGSTSNYGSVSGLSNASATMGMLLAIPGSVNINGLGLESEPGRQLAWTLQNYGAYVVDSSGGGAGMALEAESGPNGAKTDQFFSDYGLEMSKHVSRQAIDEAWTPPTFGAPTTWTRDLHRIWVQLKIVDNNASDNIGGGGTPRQPLAPPISP